MKIEETFQKAAGKIALVTGTVWAFLLAAGMLALHHFGEPYEEMSSVLVTATMFLLIFLAQNSQNRSTQAIQLKLDEILLSLDKTQKSFVGLEKESDETLEAADEEIEEGKLKQIK